MITPPPIQAASRLFRRSSPPRRTLVFLILLCAFLFVMGYGSAYLLQLGNRRKSHELSTKLIAQRIRVILSERIEMGKRLSHNPTILRLFRGLPERMDSRALLNTVNEMANTSLIYTVDSSGKTFASADSDEALLIGKNYNFRPYFQQAMQGEIALYPAVGAFTNLRGIHIGIPVVDGAGTPPLGVLVMKIDIGEIENIFLARKEKLAIVSPDGVILSTNQPDWLLRSLQPLSPEAQSRLSKTRQFKRGVIAPLKKDLTRRSVRLGTHLYNIVREPLPIPGWYVLSCQTDRPLAPMPPFQKSLWEAGLGVTAGLAVLIFYLGVNMMNRKRAEEGLRRTEEKYRSIFENAVMGVYQSTPEGRFFEASPSMASILGYDDPADLIKSVTDMRDIYVDPSDRDVWLNLLNEKRSFSGFETRYFKKDGVPIWVSLSTRLASGETGGELFLEGFCLDVTEKKEAVEALRRERDILTRIMATSPASIVLSDVNGNISYANTQAETLLDIQPMSGSQTEYTRPACEMRQLDGTPMLRHESPVWKALERGEIVLKERCMLQWPEGRQVLVSVSIAPLFDAEGKIPEYVALYEDITRTVLAEKKAAQQQQQLFEADRMIAMGILTSGIAHEINNPNTYIMSSAQTLAEAWREAIVVLDEYYEENGEFSIGGLPYATFRETLPALNARVLDGSRRIGRIIKELLIFSRRDTTKTTGTVDINKVLRTVEVLLSSMIKKSTHHFSMQLQQGELFVDGNFQRLEQVFINILQNACQALSSPDKSIRVVTRKDEKKGVAVIRVHDQGQGISKENLNRVMDPFFTTKRDSGGTGLGLAVSSTIMHDLGGTLQFESKEGVGTTTTLSLPLKPNGPVTEDSDADM